MAAVILTATAPDLRSLPSYPSAPARPDLRLVTSPHGRPAGVRPARVRPVSRLHPAVYRRRRIGAVLVLCTAVTVLWFGVGFVAGALSPADGAAVPAVPGVAATAAPLGAVHVVQPGESLWSIARTIQPEGDVRPLVDALAERAGGSGVQAGQRLSLEGLGG